MMAAASSTAGNERNRVRTRLVTRSILVSDAPIGPFQRTIRLRSLNVGADGSWRGGNATTAPRPTRHTANTAERGIRRTDCSTRSYPVVSRLTRTGVGRLAGLQDRNNSDRAGAIVSETIIEA